MLWCALHLPDLALQVFTRGSGDAAPLAILGPRPGQRVLAANPAAIARGVAAGLRPAGALALAPDLRLCERDLHLELAALSELACWAGRFTPALSLDPPATLLLELSASLRLFGGLAPLCAAIDRGVDELGFSGRLAVAPTPLAARWLAARAPGSRIDARTLPAALDALPLATLVGEAGLGEDSLELLAGIGARRLADVRRLPRNGLARRQAQAITALLDRAYGMAPDPRPWFTPPEHYASRLPLPAASAQIDTLLFGVRRLLGGLGGWLDARQVGLEAFSVVLEHESLVAARLGISRESRLDIVLGSLSRDIGRFQLLAREHLSRQPLPAPVDALRVEADTPRPLAPPCEDLFETGEDEAGDPGLLLATLRARLGAGAVRCIALHADHRPESAWRNVEPVAPASRPAPAQGASPDRPRPLWLLPAPRPISPPKPESLLAGPERIESGWWDGAAGEVRRDYYVARRHDRSLAWVFQDCLPPHGWFVHGYFA